MDKWVAITGCNGYIGGQTVLHFKDLGYKIIGIDNQLSSPHLRNEIDSFIHADFSDSSFISEVVNRNVECLLHIAGTSLVGPSITDPGIYYVNNVGNTALLLRQLSLAGWNKTVIFSSSAAVYGEPQDDTPLSENHDTRPLSPYGQSKMMAEHVLRDCAIGYGFKTISLRYFNACGADRWSRHGQSKNATHLIAQIIESVINECPFTLNGIDYPTPDGTCIRDYLHVEDIARAHQYALRYSNSMKDHTNIIFNLGTNKGTSNSEIIRNVETITHRKLQLKIGHRRKGDPAILVANAEKFYNLTGWKAEQSSIDDIIRSSWSWYVTKFH